MDAGFPIGFVIGYLVNILVALLVGDSRGRPGAGVLCGVLLPGLGIIVALFLPEDRDELARRKKERQRALPKPPPPRPMDEVELWEAKERAKERAKTPLAVPEHLRGRRVDDE